MRLNADDHRQSIRSRAFPVGTMALAALLASSTAQAQKPQEAAQHEDAAPKSSSTAFDLSYVPTDAAMVVALRPAAILKQPKLKALLETVRELDMIQDRAGIRLDAFDQAIMVINRRGPGGRGGSSHGPFFAEYGGVVLHSAQPQDWESAAKALLPEAPWVEAKFAGQTYHKATGRGEGLSYYFPDKQTIVIGWESNLFRFIERGKEKVEYPWAGAWKDVEEQDLAAVVDVGWVRGELDLDQRRGPDMMVLAAFSPLIEETVTLAAGLKSTNGVAAEVIATCGTEAGAKKVADTLQALLTLGRNVSKTLEEQIQQAPKQDLPLILKLYDVGQQALSDARVETDGKVVHLRTSTKTSIDEIVQLYMDAASHSGRPAPAATPAPARP